MKSTAKNEHLIGALADCIRDLACLIPSNGKTELSLRLNSVYLRAQSVLEAVSVDDEPDYEETPSVYGR